MLSPVSPHLMEEMYEMLAHNGSLSEAKWPTYEESYLKKNTVTIAIQVNGKLRATLEVDVDIEEEKMKEMALNLETIKKYTDGHEIKKIIVIKHKIISIVVS